MKKLLFIHILLIVGYTVSQEYKWPEYSPNVRYNFKEQNPNFEEPQNILDDCPQVVGEISEGWWTFRWGPSRNGTITDEAIYNMLDRMNEDFSYFRNVMGWPADKRARNGYKSAIYLYGSGLCTDNADSLAGGGWQSSIWHNGESWPMVLASYIPVRSFDPQYQDNFQTGAMVHEGIHAVLADMPGVKQSAWFHEGGNVWLQQTADARRAGSYNDMGNLNATDLMAPFMPIECYSGWLVDGTFGGPSAEGVNKYNDEGQQLCTWRRTLGGHQYSSMFPTALAQILGDGVIPWIWVNCPGRVLEGLADGIGEEQMRRAIVEYRSKMALLDLGEWTRASIRLLNNNFGNNIGAEWEPSYMQPELWRVTPYARTSRNGNTLTPEQRTLPGWSGSNQIPLVVNGDKITVNFEPLGENMTCQLAYRTTSGKPIYSEFVPNGNCTIELKEKPADNIVIAVITNTDYIYEGEQTRTAKFDYRLNLVEGISNTADINTRWYESANLDDLRTVTFYGSVDGEGGSISPEISGYLIGDTATITAYPIEGFDFVGWSGDVISTENPIKIVMNEDISLTATFSVGPRYSLNHDIIGNGSVSPKEGDYARGSTQSLLATPAPGYQFKEWTGDASGTDNPYSILMNTDKNVVAVFEPIPTIVQSYNLNMPPKSSYDPISIIINTPEIEEFFDLTYTELQNQIGNTITYNGVNKDGSFTDVSTAIAPGNWYNSNGNIVSYGGEAYMYAELKINNMTVNIGQYPDRTSLQDTVTLRQALVYRDAESDLRQVILEYKILISNVISSVNKSNEQGILLYPNPSNSSFTLELEEAKEIQLFTLGGIKIESFEKTNFLQFGDKLDAGVYLIRIGSQEYLRLMKN